MRGLAEILPFIVLFVLLLLTAYSINTSLYQMGTDIATSLAQWENRRLLASRIDYNGECNGNYIPVFALGDLEDYDVRLVCIDREDICVVESDGGPVIKQVNPGQRIEFNLASCGPTFVQDCNQLRCVVVGRRSIIPISPK